MEADTCLLKIEKLSKYFGPVQALKNVSFSLQQSEILGLLGDNGAGKSTLIKIIKFNLRRHIAAFFIF